MILNGLVIQEMIAKLDSIMLLGTKKLTLLHFLKFLKRMKLKNI
nr:MAG TPA: hypothetical protein [Crassvirales sp.]